MSGQSSREFSRSACPQCGHKLGVLDLVPLFSWLCSGGKCRYCKRPIGTLYPLVELITLLACLGVYCAWGFSVQAALIMSVIPVLVALFVIDSQHMVLPNVLVFSAGVLAVFFIFIQAIILGPDHDFWKLAGSKLLAGLIFPLLVWLVGRLMRALLKKEALGMGDIKFLAVAGLWLGIEFLPFFLVFSGLCGVLTGLFFRFFMQQERFPFGPALILALYTGILLQGMGIAPFIVPQ